ncbi:protein of unknown function [Pararobbsia alpina]
MTQGKQSDALGQVTPSHRRKRQPAHRVVIKTYAMRRLPFQCRGSNGPGPSLLYPA